MKKLIAILLMLTLLMSFFSILACASAAPADDTIGESEVGGADDPESKNEEKEFKFEPSNFVDNLYYMGVGMIGIFLVIGIIVLCTVGLNRMFSGKAKEE